MFVGLWILVFIIILFFMFLKTCWNLWGYFKERDRTYLQSIAVLWMVPFGLISVLVFSSWFFGLTNVDKEKIIGKYAVDERFYPGSNADWQKKHYRFEVRPNDTFVFFERLADGSEKEYTGRIKWANERVEKWSISMDSPHHVVPKHPVLFREQFGFYYVFKTKKFGNMFFRKVSR